MTTNHYRQILDSLTTAIILVDAKLTIVDMNAAAESLLEISAKQVVGASFKRYFHESSEALEQMLTGLDEGAQYTKRKASWRLHSGNTITIDYTVTPLPDQGQLLMELQPLDRLLRISREEDMMAYQETTKNLLRGLAHEVKNPLGGIRGAAQLLDKERSDQDLKEYTHIIITESDRLRNLVDRMLGSRQLPELQPTNIHEVLERVWAIINAENPDKVNLQRNYDPSIPDVTADIEMLIQAILNIVRNAMQALLSQENNQSPQITLRTRINRKFTIGRTYHPLVIKICVEDNGPGIPTTIQQDIFYPMISGRAEGSGLGLAISQQLITQHKGLIECTSEPGQTIFSVYIPLDVTS